MTGTTNPETPLEIAKEWVAELSVMTPDLDETVKVKASDIRALARAVIEAEKSGQAAHLTEWGQQQWQLGRDYERARIVAAIRKRGGAPVPREFQILVADWIERGCLDE